MTTLSKKFLALALLCTPSIAHSYNDNCLPCDTTYYNGGTSFGLTFFNRRSEGVRVMYESLGWYSLLYTDCEDGYLGALKATIGGGSSFRKSDLGSMLFFNGIDTMVVGPQGGEGVDVSSVNLLLPNNFLGTITARPTITSAVIRFNAYVDLCCWCNGLFGRVGVPVNWVKYQLGLCETTEVAGPTGYYCGEFNVEPSMGSCATTLTAPNKTIIEGFAGANVVGNDSTKWVYGKWDPKGMTTAGVADVQLALGYNFVSCDEKRFGLLFFVNVPTDDAPTSEFFFEPTIGDTKHCGIGGVALRATG